MKLKKFIPGLVSAIQDAGFDQTPKEIQDLAIPAIRSGADVIVHAPEGTGKSTALVISLIQQLKQAMEEAPRAIVVVPTKEKAFELEEQFKTLARNTDLRTFVVFDKGILQYQKDMIYEGLDILIGTPARIDELLSATGIPMVKVKILAFDDAEQVLVPKYQHIVYRLAYALPKVQKVLLANEWSERFEELEERALTNPLVLELPETDEQQD
ncbi:DEAD/DEAH box helicase [Mangrovibacterium marinum]|uniref:RAD3-like DEAD/DEAH box helicase n=1 Tax=Mangrovibacterium marinum TaxID=1639118 RepID=A0A2T5C3A7_9BACT|nr:DEAD/DEAH box helicase [Mangrovibacterium marinum]PTN09260.1 RAD3-like DEAD/DEAH box helicase [Mangrovibacterium marinum]